MRTHRRSAHIAGLAAAALFALAGCGSGSDDQASDTPAAATPAETSAAAAETSSEAAATTEADEAAANPVITIKDFAYGDPLTVAPGTTITVINEDSAPHDVDATDDSSFATDLLDQGGQTTFAAPGAAGTYEFTCSKHPQMLGELIVQ